MSEGAEGGKSVMDLFEQLCSCHGGHGSHGRHGDGGHCDVFEDGLCHTRVGYFVLTESPNDHLAHFPAGITAHCQQRLDVLLPADGHDIKNTATFTQYGINLLRD